MNKKLLGLLLFANICVFFVLPKDCLSYYPQQTRPQAGRCGDGICDEVENKNPNACPGDCLSTRSSSSPQSTPSGQTLDTGDKNTFIMIHFEAGYKARLTNNLPPGLYLPEEYSSKPLCWQEYFWPTAVELVQKADEFNFKLTLAFNPQWAEYIFKDNAKVKLVKQWQAEGHEIAFHHHAINHVDWNGYSNDSGATRDSLYLGTADKGFIYVKDLVADGNIVSGTLGGLPLDFPAALKGKDFILIGGNQFDSYAKVAQVSHRPVKSLKPARKPKSDGGYLIDLTIREFSTVMKIPLGEAMPELQEQYRNMNNDEIFGIVWHEFDYCLAKDMYIEWFKFIKNQGDKVQTAREIVASYYKKTAQTTVQAKVRDSFFEVHMEPSNN